MPRVKSDSTVTHRIEFSPKERQYVEQLVAGQTVKNIVVPTAIVAGVGSAAYLGYKSLKACFGWTEDIAQELWEETILSTKNREEYRESASQPSNSPYSGEGPSQRQTLIRTFHFWTGGLFLNDA